MEWKEKVVKGNMRPWRDVPQLQRRLNKRKKNGWRGIPETF